VNENDVTQGTGRPRSFQSMDILNVTAYDIMLSTITALKMQLLGQSTVGNCCSHFHLVIQSLLNRGCGSVSSSRFQCLQEKENPAYRLCCKTKQRCVTKNKQLESGSDILHPQVQKYNIEHNITNDKLWGKLRALPRKKEEICGQYVISDIWLNGTRLGNINEEAFTDVFLSGMMLNSSLFQSNNGLRHILKETICMENSRFVNWERTMSNSGIISRKQIRKDMAFRLIYLAIHEHQHRFARKEASHRLNCNNKSGKLREQLTTSNVGKFDYECPDAKYIVSYMPRMDQDATLRLGIIDLLFLGIVSNRVTLIMNNIPIKPNSC